MKTNSVSGAWENAATESQHKIVASFDGDQVDQGSVVDVRRCCNTLGSWCVANSRAPS